MYKIYLKSFLSLNFCRHYYYAIDEPYNGTSYELHPGLKPYLTTVNYHGVGRLENINYLCLVCKTLVDDHLNNSFNILWRNCDTLAGLGIQTILAWFMVILMLSSVIVPKNITLAMFMALVFLANAHIPVRVKIYACPHVTVLGAKTENYAKKNILLLL